MHAGLLQADGAILNEGPVRSSGDAGREALGRAADPFGDRNGLAADPFGDRYASLAPDVERLCRRILGPGPDAEDASHEVYLRARAGFDRYDPHQPFRRWLLTVAAHHCIDRVRRRKLEGRLFQAGELDAGDLPGRGPSPLRAALDAEARRRLHGAIDALPDRYRLPLVLRYFAELPYEAIAEALDVARGQVGTLLFRAKARLRREASGAAGRSFAESSMDAGEGDR